MSTKYETGLGKPFPDRIFAPLQKKIINSAIGITIIFHN